MTNEQLGQLTLAIALLLATATILGQLFARLRQPKVIGEILAGVLFGPTILGQLAPAFAHDVFGVGAASTDHRTVGLAFVYQLGLVFLMFVSGAHVRNVLGRDNRRETAWLLSLGTALPFGIALAISLAIPTGSMRGPADSIGALSLVFASAVAVTSIPVITRIFSDLGILHTRFASLMLGTAVLEDILLWGVLSIATAIATATLASHSGDLTRDIAVHVGVNVAFVVVAMSLMPRVLRWLGRHRLNVVAQQTPVTWILLVLLGYVSVAGLLDVTPVFAAFLAGFGLIGGVSGSERLRFRSPIDTVASFSQSLFIPVYFAIVGLKLDFTKHFSIWLTLGFLIGSSALHCGCAALAARGAGFRGRAVLNLGITSNARGGPGIVLASVALEAGIISQSFFTALVVTAVLTSQVCGVWLDHVLRKGWSLLGSDDDHVGADADEDPGEISGPRIVVRADR